MTQTTSPTSYGRAAHPRVEVVQTLRGLAALAVAWFHFTNGNVNFLPNGLLKSSGQYGWLGVYIFFVISGFVLPYSLFIATYQLNVSNYSLFIWKRVSRLDPPYLASIAIVLLLSYLSSVAPGFRGVKPEYSVSQILSHIAYLNTFLGRPWLNIVYWSLAIEFQYYVLLGFLFPLLSGQSRVRRLALLVGMACVTLGVRGDAFVFHYFFLFIAGLVAFWQRAGLANLWEVVTVLVLSSIGLVVTHGLMVAAAALITSLIIIRIDTSLPAFALLGELSYSMYLVHVPVGGRVINLSERLGGGQVVRLLALIVAVSVSMMAAFGLFHLVELPCRRYASSIRFIRASS